MSNDIPISVNYTNRDFYSLRTDLIERIQNKLSAAGKTWTASDPADFGLAIVDTFAYVGDLTNHYIDRMANETYLATATQRQTILNIAKSYNYAPAGYRQAFVSVTISNPTLNSITVPMGALFYVDIVTPESTTTKRLLFTSQEDVVVPAATVSGSTTTPGTITTLFAHGEDVSLRAGNEAIGAQDVAGELLGSSDGSTNQVFTLSENQVVDGSVTIYVKNGDYYVSWDQVDHIVDYGPTDTVYELVTDADNYVSVYFGDGVSGAVPANGETIKAVYIVGGGTDGNIQTGLRFSLKSLPVGSPSTSSQINTLSVINTTIGYGGENPEDNDSIRRNAPKALTTLNRAVSLKDYANLALSVGGVGKAAAYASNPSLINLYIGPAVSDTSEDYYPGFDANNATVTSSWSELQTLVSNFFIDKTQIGTSIAVLPPKYTLAHVTIYYTKLPGYTDAQIQSAINYTLIYGFGYNFTPFDEPLFPEDIESALITIEGVRTAKVISLYKNGEAVSRNTITPDEGEIIVFRDSVVNLYPTAALSSLTASTGTWSSTFSPITYLYTLSGVATPTITLTPTAFDASSVITVNGVIVTSGSTTSDISTPSGTTTTITIVSESADGSASNTYTIKVPR